MANLTPTASFDDVYQLETADPVEGGAGGITNRQPQELANRTEWLKEQLELYQARAQARTGIVFTGKYDSTTGDYNALTAPASNTLRLNADVSFPFIFSASGGYDDLGEIAQTRKLTSNIGLSTASLGNRDFLAILTVSPSGVGSTELYFAEEAYYYATPYEPTAPTSETALWYNTATGKHYIGNGGNWVEWRVVVVGRFVKSGGNIASVETFPYREPYYDEDTQAGTVRTFAANATPRGGWLACNGSAVSRVVYRKLFTAISTTYGVGNGATTFNLPDLRGEFIRGVDDGRSVDAARAFGSSQADALEAHTHDISGENRLDGAGNPITVLSGAGAIATTLSTGSTETRPRNVAMRYWIKY